MADGGLLLLLVDDGRRDGGLDRVRNIAALSKIKDLGPDEFELALVVVLVPDEEEQEQHQEMVVHHEALGQRQAAGFLEHVVVHFAPTRLARDRLVLVAGRDVPQGLGETGQDDVEVVHDQGGLGGVHPAAVGQVAEELAGTAGFLGQSHHVWVQGFSHGRAETVETWDMNLRNS